MANSRSPWTCLGACLLGALALVEPQSSVPPTPSGADASIIHLSVTSVLGQYAHFAAQSTGSPEAISQVYLPLRVGVDVDLGRGREGGAVRSGLAGPGARPEEWHLCVSFGEASAGLLDPGLGSSYLGGSCTSRADCAPILAAGRSFPVVHHLAGQRVHFIAAWLEHRPQAFAEGPRGASRQAAKRYSPTTLAFVALEPEDRGEWFSHIVGDGSLPTPWQQHEVLRASFLRSPHAEGFGVAAEALGEPSLLFTTEYKLRHDMEQLEYIASVRPALSPWLLGHALPAYSMVHARAARALREHMAKKKDPKDHALVRLREEEGAWAEVGAFGGAASFSAAAGPAGTHPGEGGYMDSMGLYHLGRSDLEEGCPTACFGHIYNRLLFDPPPKQNRAGDGTAVGTLAEGLAGLSAAARGRIGGGQGGEATVASQKQLNPLVRWGEVEAEYLQKAEAASEAGGQAAAGVRPVAAVVVDDLLRPQALERLQQIMRESTVWYETKSPMMGGYLGAYAGRGLDHPELLGLADEIARALPAVLGRPGHKLRFLWAYKYDSAYQGIAVHADRAAINVNIWLTPDEANLEPGRGGLVVYASRSSAREQLSGSANNGNLGLRQTAEMSGWDNVTVAYKANRMTLFDSSLYHRTDNFKFKPGYKNRRINLTLLYGAPELE